METTIVSAEEAAEFGEFKRSRREAEIALLLKKVVVDASRRETDRHALKGACDCAKKFGARGVLVSPVGVSAAKKFLAGAEPCVVCLVGGTGESLPALKRAEAKRAARQGAREILLVPCYSALAGGNASYLKREVKKVKRAAKRNAVFLLLDDHTLTEDDVALGTRAAKEGRADGVCVRGEPRLVLRALTVGGGRLSVHCTGVENAAQLRTAVRAGAMSASSRALEEIAEELYFSLGEPAAEGEFSPPPAPDGV